MPVPVPQALLDHQRLLRCQIEASECDARFYTEKSQLLAQRAEIAKAELSGIQRAIEAYSAADAAPERSIPRRMFHDDSQQESVRPVAE